MTKLRTLILAAVATLLLGGCSWLCCDPCEGQPDACCPDVCCGQP